MEKNKFKKFIVSLAGLGVFYSIFFVVISLISGSFSNNYLRNRSYKICNENIISIASSEWETNGNVVFQDNSILISSNSSISFSKEDEYKKYPKYFTFSSASNFDLNKISVSAFCDENKVSEQNPEEYNEGKFEVFFYNDFTNISKIIFSYFGTDDIEVSSMRFSYLKDISYGG